jgi:uncharacterized protein YndB with AHSA1/START domain
VSDYADVPAPGVVRLERVLPAPVERVWSYLTDPELRSSWFAGGPMDLRVGGEVELRYAHALISDEPIPERFRPLVVDRRRTGRITRCEPPLLLAFSWHDGGHESEVVFELEPAGQDTRLTLTHRRLPDAQDLIDAGSGWHAHLDMLEDRLRGDVPRPFWATHARLEAEYARHIPELL